MPCCGTALSVGTTYDKAHSNPHTQPPTHPLADEEVDYATGESSQVVNRNNDALLCTSRITESFSEMFIAHNAAEDTLVVAEENELCSSVPRSRLERTYTSISPAAILNC